MTQEIPTMKNVAAGRSKRILFNAPKDHQIKINAAIIFKIPLSLFTCILLSYPKFINYALLLLPKQHICLAEPFVKTNDFF